MKKSLISVALLFLLSACYGGNSAYNTYGTTYSSSSSQVSDQSFINSKLSGRALSPIEGIWYYDPGGRKIGIYKSGDSYVAKVLWSQQVPIGAKNFDVEATSNSDYYGSYYLYDPQGNRYEGYTELSLYGNSARIMIIDSQGYKRSYDGDRIVRTWPTNLSYHNSNFRAAEENRIIAKSVNKEKNNLALKIIPELNNLDARLGISGSFIEPNQIFEKKNAIDTPKKIKILKIHKIKLTTK